MRENINNFFLKQWSFDNKNEKGKKKLKKKNPKIIY